MATSVFAVGLVSALGCDQRTVVPEGVLCPPPYGVFCPADTFCAIAQPAPGDQGAEPRYLCLPLRPGCNPADLCHCGVELPDGGRGLSCTSCTQVEPGLVDCSQ